MLNGLRTASRQQRFRVRGHNFFPFGACLVLNYFSCFLSWLPLKTFGSLELLCSQHIGFLNARMLDWYHFNISIWNNILYYDYTGIFLRLEYLSFKNNKRLSCLKIAYLKIEKDTPLILKGCKFTIVCLAGVMVPVNQREWQCCWKFWKMTRF